MTVGNQTKKKMGTQNATVYEDYED